jgi:phage shock protein PspC (stress-responsive transcriptional regulator)
MKKTINVNLNGRMFTLDEDACRMLENYLHNLHLHFEREDGSAEIMADFEARIQEIFSEQAAAGKQVFSLSDVEEVIGRMGNPADFQNTEQQADHDASTQQQERQPSAPRDSAQSQKESRRRFFRNGDDKMIGGVCSGLAAFFGWETLPIRIVMILLIFLTGFWIIPAYLIVWLIAPQAVTAEEKLQMRGQPVTVESIGRTVSENLNAQSDKSGCLSKFVRGTGLFLKFCFYIVAAIIVVPLMMAVVCLVFALILTVLGVGTGLLSLMPLEWFGVSDLITVTHPLLAAVSFILALLIPLAVIVYSIVALIGRWKPVHWGVKLAGFLLWIAAIVGFFCSGIRINTAIDYYRAAEFVPDEEDFSPLGSMNLYRGNGIPAERSFKMPVTDMLALGSHFAANVEIVQAESGAFPADSMEVTISGDENLLDFVECDAEGRFSGGHLRLKATDELKIRIVTPGIRRIRVEGAGKVSIPGRFTAEALRLDMNGMGVIVADSLAVNKIRVCSDGAGAISLQGKAVNVSYELQGLGSITADGLVADSVTAHLEGVGKISCNPVDYLNAEIGGIGSIRYPKEPRSSKKIQHGIGTIRKI